MLLLSGHCIGGGRANACSVYFRRNRNFRQSIFAVKVVGAGGRTRTDTTFYGPRILSPVRLPFRHTGKGGLGINRSEGVRLEPTGQQNTSGQPRTASQRLAQEIHQPSSERTWPVKL